MRVAAAHHRALVLEHLDVADVRVRPERLGLVRPGLHHAKDRLRLHLGEGQVVARREAHDAAASRGGLGHQEAVPGTLGRARSRQQGREVVVEANVVL
jgi:hypothetical protein